MNTIRDEINDVLAGAGWDVLTPDGDRGADAPVVDALVKALAGERERGLKASVYSLRVVLRDLSMGIVDLEEDEPEQEGRLLLAKVTPHLARAWGALLDYQDWDTARRRREGK